MKIFSRLCFHPPPLSSVSESWRHQTHQSFLQLFVPGVRNFPYRLLHILSKAAVHIWIFNLSGFILSMCENGIPSSFPQESSVALALFARLACLSFPLALQGHPGHNSGSSVSGFSATLLEFIRLSLSQDHTPHSLEPHTFSIHLARQPSPTPQHTHLPPCSSWNLTWPSLTPPVFLYWF